MSPGVTQTSSGATGTATSSSSSTTTPATPPVTENMFLQDPTNPTDSTQFVTQLAQFQTMEQSLNQGTDISAIRADLDQLVTSLGSGATTSST
jgi:flagellar basal-body rod modification protein FlgD